MIFAKYSTRQHGGFWCCRARGSAPRAPGGLWGSEPRRGRGSLGVRRAAGARGQRGRGPQYLFGEPAPAGGALLGGGVGPGPDVLRLGQLVDKRQLYRRDLGGDGLDGLDPGLDRVDDGLLALADGVQDLVLDLLGGVAGHDVCLLYLASLLTIPSTDWDVKRSAWRMQHAVGQRAGYEVDHDTELRSDRDATVLGVCGVKA